MIASINHSIIQKNHSRNSFMIVDYVVEEERVIPNFDAEQDLLAELADRHKSNPSGGNHRWKRGYVHPSLLHYQCGIPALPTHGSLQFVGQKLRRKTKQNDGETRGALQEGNGIP